MIYNVKLDHVILSQPLFWEFENLKNWLEKLSFCWVLAPAEVKPTKNVAVGKRVQRCSYQTALPLWQGV